MWPRRTKLVTLVNISEAFESILLLKVTKPFCAACIVYNPKEDTTDKHMSLPIEDT